MVSMHFFKLLDFVCFFVGFGGFESELLVLIRALQVGPNSFCGHLISQSRMSLRCTIKIQDRSIPRGVLHQGPPF